MKLFPKTEAEDNVTGIHPSLSLYLGWIPCEHYLEQPRLDSQVAHAPPTFLLPFQWCGELVIKVLSLESPHYDWKVKK